MKIKKYVVENWRFKPVTRSKELKPVLAAKEKVDIQYTIEDIQYYLTNQRILIIKNDIDQGGNAYVTIPYGKVIRIDMLQPTEETPLGTVKVWVMGGSDPITILIDATIDPITVYKLICEQVYKANQLVLDSKVILKKKSRAKWFVLIGFGAIAIAGYKYHKNGKAKPKSKEEEKANYKAALFKLLSQIS